MVSLKMSKASAVPLIIKQKNMRGGNVLVPLKEEKNFQATPRKQELGTFKGFFSAKYPTTTSVLSIREFPPPDSTSLLLFSQFIRRPRNSALKNSASFSLLCKYFHYSLQAPNPCPICYMPQESRYSRAGPGQCRCGTEVQRRSWWPRTWTADWRIL